MAEGFGLSRLDLELSARRPTVALALELLDVSALDVVARSRLQLETR